MSRLLNKKVILEEIVIEANSCGSLEEILKLLSKEAGSIIEYRSLHAFISLKDEAISYYHINSDNLSKRQLLSDSFTSGLSGNVANYIPLKLSQLKETYKKSSNLEVINDEYIISFKLLFRGKSNGFILLSGNNDLSTQENKLNDLTKIINLLGVYIDNFLLAEEVANSQHFSNNETIILNDIIKKAISTLKISDLMDYLVNYLTKQTNFDRVFVLLQNKDKLSSFEGVIGTIENKQKISIEDLNFDNLDNLGKFNNYLKQVNVISSIIDHDSFFAIPLIVRGKINGLLGVDNYFKQKPVTANEIKLLQSIGSQIDISIDNALLYEDMQLNALGFKHLFEVASSFNTILDYEQAAKVIVEKIANSIAVSQGYLISFEVDNYSKIIASVTENNLHNAEIELTEPLKQAIVTKCPVTYNYQQQPKVKCLDLKYALIVPLFIKNKLIGLLCLGEEALDQERLFTDHDIKLVQTIANQAVITLENAQLYNKLEDMVVERTVELIDSNRALQKQKEKLELLSQRLQAIISSIPDGILVINKDNQILSSNPAFMGMLNFISEEIQIDSLIGLSLMKLITFISNKDNKNRKHFGDLLEKIVEGDGNENDDLDLVLENGVSHYYKVLTAPVKINNDNNPKFRPNGTEKNNQVIVFHDVTKEKEIDKLKSDFIAVVSHELKTPVSAMMGFATLIEDGIAGEITAEQQEYLNKIQIQGERLIRLINDLLDFSKLEAGQMPLYMQLLDADEVINEIVETLRPLADEKSIELRSEIEEDLPPIYVDPDKLKQILINLISNAIKFTPETTGLIRVTVNHSEERKALLFSVNDNGIGIPDKDKVKLFDSFYQVDNSSTRKYGGTGLGLAIVKKLTDLNKGEVWVESKIGTGSTFYFTVPLPEENQATGN